MLVSEDTIVDAAPFAPGVELTPRLDRPASFWTSLVDTLIVLAAPVVVERNTR